MKGNSIMIHRRKLLASSAAAVAVALCAPAVVHANSIMAVRAAPFHRDRWGYLWEIDYLSPRIAADQVRADLDAVRSACLYETCVSMRSVDDPSSSSVMLWRAHRI